MSLKMAEAESEGLISTSAKKLDLIVARTSTELKESKGLVSKGKRRSTQGLRLRSIWKGLLKKKLPTLNEGLHSKSKRKNVRNSLESRRGTVPIVSSAAEQPYSCLATLATLSVGLASTRSVARVSRLRESTSLNSFFQKEGGGREKTLDRSFQMQSELSQVVVGNVDGFDSVFCGCFVSSGVFSSEVSSFYESGRSGILGKSHVGSVEAILFGTELFTCGTICDIVVGNFGGRGTKISPSNSLDNDHTAHRTTHSNIVEHPGDYVPGVIKYAYENTWRAVDNSDMFRSLEGSYLEKPKFMKTPDPYVGVESSALFEPLQLTRYDDYVVMSDRFWRCIREEEVNDIVRQNAFESADVVAAQLAKCVMERLLSGSSAHEKRAILRAFPISVVVILLDHDKIVLRESARGKKGNVASKEVHEEHVAEEVSQSTTLGHDENKGPPKAIEEIMEMEIGEKKVMVLEEDYKMKGVLDESLPIERLELGMKSSSSSNPMEAEVKDVFKAMSCLTVNEDFDYKHKDITESKDISKWIIHIDQQEKALLCFFNIEEMQYEFYFEDYESMASIVGVGVDYSKVVIKSTSSYLAVVEILKEDWDVVWEKNSSGMQHLFSRDSILKHEAFPDILHSIAKFVSNDNIVNSTNDGGDDGGEGKEKSEENVDAHKGNGGVLNNDSIGESTSGSNEDSDTFDNDKLNGENGHGGGEENGVDEEDGNAHDDIKEVSAVVYLLLLPGGIPEENKKKRIIAKNQEKRIIAKNQEKRRTAKQKTSAILGLFGKAKKEESGNNSAFDECVENAKAQLKDQIHSQMKFTFTKRVETRGILRTIQATIEPITFQFEERNEDNYMDMRRFGWFHTHLEVAFGVVNPHVAHLEPTSFKVINSLEGKEAYAATTSIGGERSSANDYQLKVEGNAQVMKIRGEVGRSNKTSSHKTIEVSKSLESPKPLTECDFLIKLRPNLNSGELRYVYDPKLPFNGEEFEEASEEDRLKMYSLPLCSPQSVSFEGTWKPDSTLDSKKVEAYKLQAKRDVEMTKPYNGDFQRRKKSDWGALEKNLERGEPFFFVQSLEKIVFLNHAFSHLDCGIYRLQERHRNPSQTVITQAQEIQEPIWPSSIPLVDVNEHCALVSS